MEQVIEQSTHVSMEKQPHELPDYKLRRTNAQVERIFLLNPCLASLDQN